MFRYCLKQIKTWITGKPAGKSSFRRPASPPRRAILSVETLETRDLMSSVPGFTLTGGNLYNTAISQTQPIDTGAQSIAVVNNVVYDLHTNGVAEAMSPTGAGAVSVTTGSSTYRYQDTYTSMQLDGAGAVIALGSDGYLSRFAPGSTQGQWIDSHIKSFLIDGAGCVVSLNSAGPIAEFTPGTASRVYVTTGSSTYRYQDTYSSMQLDGAGAVVALGTDGYLTRFAPGSIQGQWIDSHVQSLALGNDGNAYYLHNGSLYNGTTGADVHDNVLGIAQGPNGQIWVNLGTNGLRLYNRVNPSYPGYGIVQGLALGNDGNAYYLQNGSLYNGTTGADVHDNVLGIAQGPNGQIWVNLGTNGLRLYNPVNPSYPGYGIVQGLALGNDGNAYYLQNGTMYNGTLVTQGQSGVVEPNVLGIDQGPSGQVWVNLGSNGLRLYNPANPSYPGYGIVQGLALGNDGNAYYLQNGTMYNGTLVADGQSGAMEQNVLAIAQGLNGQIWVNLRPDGLRLYNPANTSYAGYGVVQDFSVGKDGTVYYVQNGAGYVNGRAVWSQTRDMAVGADGSLFWLSDYGLLQKLVPGGSWQNLATGVSKFVVVPDGTCYSVVPGSDMGYVDARPVWANTKDIAVGPDGSLFWLSDYGLLQKLVPGGSWQNLATGVSKFVVAPDGTCYSVVPGTDMGYVDARPVWANTKDIAVGPDGSLFWLSDYRLLQKLVPGGSWQNLATGVSKFVVAPDGTCYSVVPGTDMGYVDARPVWANTKDIAVGPDGSLFWLSDYGLLQKLVPGGSWQNLATGVSKFVVAPDGTCYSVVPGTDMGYVDARPVWANTKDIAVGPDGSLFWLSDYGLLQKLVPGGSWQNLATGVSNIAVETNGYLYEQTAAGAVSWINLDDPLPNLMQNLAEAGGLSGQWWVRSNGLAASIQEVDGQTILTDEHGNTTVAQWIGPNSFQAWGQTVEITQDAAGLHIGWNGNSWDRSNWQTGALAGQWMVRSNGLVASIQQSGGQTVLTDEHGNTTVAQWDSLTSFSAWGQTVQVTQDAAGVHLLWSGNAWDLGVCRGNGPTYVLASQTLYQLTGAGGTWGAISGTNIASFSLTPAGEVVALRSDNQQLWFRTVSGIWSAISGANIASFSLTPAGEVVALRSDNQQLWFRTVSGVWSAVSGTNIASFSLTPAGEVVALRSDNQQLWFRTVSGVWSAISGTNIASFSLTPAGEVVALRSDNQQLWFRTVSGVWSAISGTNIASFSLTPAGEVVALDNSGNLWEQTSKGAASFSSKPIATGILAFAVNRSDLLVWTNSAVLESLSYSGTPDGSVTPLPNTFLFGIAGDGTIVAMTYTTATSALCTNWTATFEKLVAGGWVVLSQNRGSYSPNDPADFPQAPPSLWSQSLGGTLLAYANNAALMGGAPNDTASTYVFPNDSGVGSLNPGGPMAGPTWPMPSLDPQDPMPSPDPSDPHSSAIDGPEQPSVPVTTPN